MSYRRFILILIYILFFTPPSCVQRRVVTRNAGPGERAYRSTSASRLSEHIRSVIKVSSQNTSAAQKRRKGFLDQHPKLANLDRSLSQDPDDLDSHRLLARAYMKEKLYLPAFQLYQELQLRAGPDPHVSRAMGRIWEQWGDYSMARRYTEHSLAMNPNSVDSLELMGQIHLHRNDPDRAISAFSQALEIAPQSASLLSQLGSAYLLEKDWKQALSCLERATELQPTLLEAHEKLSVVRSYFDGQNSAEHDSLLEEKASAKLQRPVESVAERYPVVVHLSLSKSSPSGQLADKANHSGQAVDERKTPIPGQSAGSYPSLYSVQGAGGEAALGPDRSTWKEVPVQVELTPTKKRLEALHQNRWTDLPRLPDPLTSTVQGKGGNDSLIEAAAKSLLLPSRTSKGKHPRFDPTAAILGDPFTLGPTLAVTKLLDLTPTWKGQRLNQSAITPLWLTEPGEAKGAPIFPLSLVAFLLLMGIAPAAIRRQPRSVPGRSRKPLVELDPQANRSREDDSETKQSSDPIRIAVRAASNPGDSTQEQGVVHPKRGAQVPSQDSAASLSEPNRLTNAAEVNAPRAIDTFTEPIDPKDRGADRRKDSRKISQTQALGCIAFGFLLVCLLRRGNRLPNLSRAI